MNWDKAQAILFFRKYTGHHVIVKEEKIRSVFQGKVLDVDELDLCSTSLVETHLQLEQAQTEVALTFHEDFLGVHIIVPGNDAYSPQVSLPYKIAYDELILEKAS